jgi:Tfp pilus assembly protein PilF
MGQSSRKKKLQKTAKGAGPQAEKWKPEAPSGWIQRRGWMVPVFLALLVYVNVLHSGVFWDDNMAFKTAPPPPSKVFQPNPPHPNEGYQGPGLAPQAYYRPLMHLSMEADRAIWGSNPVGFHFSVYLANAAVTLLFYGCLVLLMDFYRKDRGIAVAAASLFAVHPMHVETVAWIAGRNDVFTSLFVLIALFAYLRYRRSATAGMIVLFAAGMILGLSGKETAIPFMLIFPVLDFLLQRSGTVPWRGMKDPILWVWGLILGGYVLIRLSRVMLPPAHGGGGAAGPSQNSLATFFVSLGYYLKLLAVPYPLNLFIENVPAGDNRATAWLLIGLVGSVGILWMLIRGTRSLWGVAAVWFILGLAAPMVVPFVRVSATPLAERYAYLASGGFVLFVALALFGIRDWRPSRIPWAESLLGVIVVLFSVMTLARNAVWRDEVALWKDTIRKSPEASFPHFNLGLVYELKKQNYDDAIRQFREGLEIDPKSSAAHNRLANLLMEKGLLDDSQKEYQLVSELQPDSASSHYNLAVIEALRKRDQEAEREFQSAIRLNPDHANAHYNLGLNYANRGKFSEAIGEFKAVLRIQPRDPAAYAILGDLYRGLRKLPESIESYRKSLEIDPDYPTAHLSLGLVYAETGNHGDAVKEIRAALRLRPDFPEAKAALSRLSGKPSGQGSGK